MRRVFPAPPPACARPGPRSRRGTVLLVVILLFSLFTAVGLSFVYYASAHGASARTFCDAQTESRPDVEPELLLDYYLGLLLYDVPDDIPGVYSALRGHSLARNMYGAGGAPAGANLVPFNGVGRLRTPSPFGTLVPGAALDDDRLINYTYYPHDPQLPPGQRFLRDPERPGWRPGPTAPRGGPVVGCNAPYTYPDLNNVYLAAVRADGTVLLPSFHRPWAAEVAGAPAGAGHFCDPGSGLPNPWWAPAAAPPAWFKYTTLRPLPALNPGFPPPEDGGGDVKNLVAGPGTFRRFHPQTGRPEYWDNDSFWMDIGFPVLTAPDGRKYKPLFAALITDLDNRVNVNVHGNVRGPGPGHASNQGWGPWEVNLGRVLTRGGGREWRNLLLGSAATRVTGRYGGRPWARQFGTPGLPGEAAPPDLLTHFYAQVDGDGANEWAAAPSGPLLLPGFGGPPATPFPSFSSPAGTYAGYGNRSPAERLAHPQLFNVFWPAGDNRRLSVADMEALLRYGDRGSPALTADLFRLCPANFADPRLRRLVTTDSADLDRPGVPPWVHNPAAFPYAVPPTTDPDQPALPHGPPIPFPPVTDARPGGDFAGADWRSLSAALGRVNLNRPLPPYPHQGSGRVPPFGPPLTVRDGRFARDVPFNVDAPAGPVWQQFLLAQQARQALANDIYRRLLAVTGVPPLRLEQHPHAPPAEFLRPRRWLAQLAANIVDYLDEDDISTPFCFYTAEDYAPLPLPPPVPPDPTRVDRTRRADGWAGEIQWPLYWVFGTELPRLVVNEALAEARRNDPDEAYRSPVRVFVELHNPFPRAVAPGTHAADALPVPLWMGWGFAAYSPYRVVVGVKTAPPSPFPGGAAGAAVLPGPENNNVLGNPELAAVRAFTTDADFVDGLAAAGGFVLLGPPAAAPAPFPAFDPFAGRNAALIPPGTPLLRTPSLQYLRRFQVRHRNDPPDERTQGVTVLLRRLANPYLPFDGRRGLAGVPNVTYNPYVTVDYLENIPVQPVALGNHPPLASQGRPQPYAAHRALLQAQALRPTPQLGHTFGLPNVPAALPYDWLTHLDRPLISPMELLHVSGYQPYQLTQRFISPDGMGGLVKFNHRAPWADEGLPPGASHRLYRLFEFVETGPRATGVAAGGRIPGKVNLNTVWDPETWQALCDPQPSSYFGEAEVSAAFTQLLYDERAAAAPGPWRRTQGHVPGDGDRPFWGLGVGTYPPGDAQFPTSGLDDTPLRLLRLPPRPVPSHPYLDRQLLTKVFNHLTTRSNVFALWLTVGFFEVTDDTARPVKLGAEIGRAENRHVRHRLFAILDRTNLSIASCVTSLAQPVWPVPARAEFAGPGPWAPQTVAVHALSGTTPVPVTVPGLAWRIRPAGTLVIDAGENQEAVSVLAVNPYSRPPTVTAVFTRPHLPGAAVALADRPGAPPVFLQPVALTRLGGLAPPYPVAVTVAVDPWRSNAFALAGWYDGVPWVIRPGAQLVLDVGPNQEVVTVAPGPFALDPRTGTGSFRVAVARPHPEDFLISNTLLGNPGPQPEFRVRHPAFSAVVRYRSVIQ